MYSCVSSPQIFVATATVEWEAMVIQQDYHQTTDVDGHPACTPAHNHSDPNKLRAHTTPLLAASRRVGHLVSRYRR